MNKAILMGRLVRDPELKSTPSGVNVATFTIAVPRRFKKDETDFINCVAWRQTAEFISQWFTKGKMIAVEGSIQVRTWEDQNQKKNYITEVVVDAAYFAGEKNEGTKAADVVPLQTALHTGESNTTFSDGGMELPDIDDDLPF